jgi:hypothetical protein
LDGDAAGIRWELMSVAVLGIPLPRQWFGEVGARESAEGARYCFDVCATLPFIGHLVAYRGWLDVD